MYARHSTGFLANSVLRRIVHALQLQPPHLVFIRCTKNRCVRTPSSGCHRASNGGTASFNCSRYHSSTTACLLSLSVCGRTRRSIRLCFSSIEGGASPSETESK